MLISDWSSYVCSSDLEKIHLCPALKAKAVVLANNNATSGATRGQREIDEWDRQRAQKIHKALSYLHARCTSPAVTDAADNTHEIFDRRLRRKRRDRAARNFAAHDFLYRHVADELFDRLGDRSEEHTSELQSLMRISYAVFCLKKKQQLTENHTHL